MNRCRLAGVFAIVCLVFGSTRGETPETPKAKDKEAAVQYGEAVRGIRFGLAVVDEAAMGDRLHVGLALRFDVSTADKKTRLLNCGESAFRVRLVFKQLETGKTYERQSFDIGLPYGLGPEDIVRLDEQPVPVKKVDVHLLSSDGQQIPPSKYALTAIYENNANPKVEIRVTPNGSVQQQPYEGPLNFWAGRLVSAPVTFTVLPADERQIELKANSHLVVRSTPDGIDWKWGRQMPIRLRLKQRPGYIVGAKYDLHVLLDGKEVEFGGGGLGGVWHEGDGESFLPPRIGEQVARGAKLTLRADVTIFETAVPVQHLWQPEDGDYRVLWSGAIEGRLDK